MPDFRFHHLERRRLDAALADLLEHALAERARVVVQAVDAGQREALNERLWNYADDSFLPHGGPGDGDPATQPVYLAQADETPNGASLRVLLNPSDALRFLDAACERVIVLFEERDVDALMAARTAWKALRDGGATPSYWKEGEEGEWVKAR